MIDPHKHCPICGTPIPLDELVCSEECQTVWNQRLAKTRKSRIILLILLVIFIVVWFFITFIK